MKKRFIKWVIAIIVFVCALIVFVYNSSVIEFLPGNIDYVSFHNGEFQDYTDFEKYTFKDSEKLRKKLDNHKYLRRVKAEDKDYLAGIFENFKGWIEDEEIYPEYDLDANDVDEADYFYVEKADIHVDKEGRKWYSYYDLYYFDIQTMQGYFLHNNI